MNLDLSDHFFLPLIYQYWGKIALKYASILDKRERPRRKHSTSPIYVLHLGKGYEKTEILNDISIKRSKIQS